MTVRIASVSVVGRRGLSRKLEGLRVRVIVIRAGTGDSEMLLDALYPPE